ncbi:unnamed protein product [Camellia sinensis]
MQFLIIWPFGTDYRVVETIMLKLPAFNSNESQQLLPYNLHFSLLQTSKTQHEVAQLHSLSIKTNAFHHPSISSRLLALYTDPKINNLDYARSLFDRIEEPTLFSWNTMIKCYVENHRSHEALVLFNELLSGSAFMPDDFTLPGVIKGCARLGAAEEGKQIHGLVLKIGFGLDMYVQSSLVSMYSKCGEIDLAQKVFDKMEERDLVSWNSLMDGYARCGGIEIALELFDEMPERDAVSWTVLVDGFSKSGKVDEARKVFNRMPSRNLVSWNAMINGYMKSGDFNSARRLFDQMEFRNVITWNSMIAGYELNGQFTEALKLFQMMLNIGPMPTHATLVSAISAISGLALLSKGRWLHSYLVQNRFELDGVLGTSLIEMYSKCGSIESALSVFQAIPKKKLGHWTAIIVGLGIHGMASHALELFLEMRRARVRPHAITFIGVLNACNHAGLVDDGQRYFDMMTNEYGIEPTVEHYGCLVDILCRAGHLEEAKNVIEMMPMKQNEVIWMSLLSGARNHRNIEIGEYAALRVIEMAPEAIGCYVLLSNMYAVAGQWDKVSQVRETMKKKGLKKDPGYSAIEHKGLLHEFVVGDKSHPQIEKIYSKLSEMRERLKWMGHVPDTSQVLLCVEGEKDKEAELENHSERLAISFGLINVEPGSPICIMKNLRVCNDCHSVTKLLSKIYDREIIVRDNSRFHHFKDGLCSCMDYCQYLCQLNAEEKMKIIATIRSEHSKVAIKVSDRQYEVSGISPSIVGHRISEMVEEVLNWSKWVKGSSGVDFVESFAKWASANPVALNEAHEHYLASPDCEDALGMDQVWIAKVIKATFGENLGSSLEPNCLTELDTILGKDFGEDTAQCTEHGPAAVDHLEFTVLGKGLGVC